MTVSRKLSSKEKRYVAYCEQYYFLNRGGFPSPDQISLALNYSVTDINSFLNNEQVLTALHRRGLDWKQSGNSTELSSTQIACAITVANFADERSISVKLDELGIQPAQYFAWLQNPTYQSYVRRIADMSLENIHPEAVTSFQKLIRNGDFNAIKYYFDLTGVSQSQDITNLKVVIQQIIESVQRHVKDPVILAAISQDLIAASPVASSTRVKVIESI